MYGYSLVGVRLGKGGVRVGKGGVRLGKGGVRESSL